MLSGVAMAMLSDVTMAMLRDIHATETYGHLCAVMLWTPQCGDI